jgi:hypothetical protein
MSNPNGGLVDGAVRTTSKIIDAISNPILLFLIVLNGFVLGGVVYIWHSQRIEAMTAYSHLVDACLPSREKL